MARGPGAAVVPRCWAGLRGAWTDPAPLPTAPRAGAAPARGPGEASLASVRAGGVGEGGEQGCGDFSASHSSKRDINSTDCFRVAFCEGLELARCLHGNLAPSRGVPCCVLSCPGASLPLGSSRGSGHGRHCRGRLHHAASGGCGRGMPRSCSFCLAFSRMSGGLWFILQPFRGVFCCCCFICITTVPEGCSQAGGLVLLGAVQMQIKTVRSPKSFLASG